MEHSVKVACIAVTLVALTLALGASMVIHSQDAPNAEPVKAHVLSDGIVARITPLPNEVSNGTRQWLDASGSTCTQGILLNYTWIIEFNGTMTYGYAKEQPFKFEQLGLYKITLIVSNTTVAKQSGYAVNFTAVYSILDEDSDSLPDWWELYYFKNLDQTGSGDYDHDGYTNLEEFARQSDPTVKNAQPGLVDMLVKNWVYLVAIVAVIVVAFVLLFPRYKRKQKDQVKKKIEAAIEIEKALDFEK